MQESSERQIVELAKSEGMDAALRALDEEYASLRRKLTALIPYRQRSDGPGAESNGIDADADRDSTSGNIRKYWPPSGRS